MWSWNLLIAPSGLFNVVPSYIDWVGISAFITMFFTKGSTPGVKTINPTQLEFYLSVMSGYATKIMYLIAVALLSLIIY